MPVADHALTPSPHVIYKGYLIHKQGPGEGDSYYPWEIVRKGGETVTWAHTRKEAKAIIDNFTRPTMLVGEPRPNNAGRGDSR